MSHRAVTRWSVLVDEPKKYVCRNTFCRTLWSTFAEEVCFTGSRIHLAQTLASEISRNWVSGSLAVVKQHLLLCACDGRVQLFQLVAEHVLGLVVTNASLPEMEEVLSDVRLWWDSVEQVPCLWIAGHGEEVEDHDVVEF